MRLSLSVEDTGVDSCRLIDSHDSLSLVLIDEGFINRLGVISEVLNGDLNHFYF